MPEVMPAVMLEPIVLLGGGAFIGAVWALLLSPFFRMRFVVTLAFGALVLVGAAVVFLVWVIRWAKAEQTMCDARQAADGSVLLDCQAIGLVTAFPVFNALAALAAFLIVAVIMRLRG
ncbi:MAG: hypothetical protein AAF224_02190 [Pseudomonadota bacterium]